MLDRARGRQTLAGKDPRKRRLAGAVAAHETDPVAFGDAERGALEQEPGAGTQLDTGGAEHRNSSIGRQAGMGTR
jgi:hypothetical protein